MDQSHWALFEDSAENPNIVSFVMQMLKDFCEANLSTRRLKGDLGVSLWLPLPAGRKLALMELYLWRDAVLVLGRCWKGYLAGGTAEDFLALVWKGPQAEDARDADTIGKLTPFPG
ncbi:hypothetical protein ACH5RR_018655 [Cinchona calisaya]|uniref:Uncharacterized protein n=1 Tax=Cinchona calisaya TaxID=153742 RepID=A0ABD2ZM34_9GENT